MITDLFLLLKVAMVKCTSKDLAFKTPQNFSQPSQEKPPEPCCLQEPHTLCCRRTARLLLQVRTVSPCMHVSFALRKAIGCTADSGAFSLSAFFGPLGPNMQWSETYSKVRWEMEQVHGHRVLEWVWGMTRLRPLSNSPYLVLISGERILFWYSQ